MDPSCPTIATVSDRVILPLPAELLQNLKSSSSYGNAQYGSNNAGDIRHNSKVSAKLRYKQSRERYKDRKKNLGKRLISPTHIAGQGCAGIALERVTERRQLKTLSSEEVQRMLALSCASSTKSYFPNQITEQKQARQVADRTKHKVHTLSDAQVKHLLSRTPIRRRPADRDSGS